MRLYLDQDSCAFFLTPYFEARQSFIISKDAYVKRMSGKLDDEHFFVLSRAPSTMRLARASDDPPGWYTIIPSPSPV